MRNFSELFSSTIALSKSSNHSLCVPDMQIFLVEFNFWYFRNKIYLIQTKLPYFIAVEKTVFLKLLGILLEIFFKLI